MIQKLFLMILIGILLPFVKFNQTQDEPLINNDQIESGFVFSGNATFYGLNINTSPGEVRFKIVKSGNYRILLIESDVYDETITLAGFTNSGRFIAGQNLQNNNIPTFDIAYNNEFILNFLSTNTMNDIETWLANQENLLWLNGRNFILSAQPSTLGLIEIHKNAYEYFPTENDFKILLPIPHELQGINQPQDPTSTDYNFIHEFLSLEIVENLDNTNLNTHFSMAHRVKINPNNSVSLLISPKNNFIYITINNDPSRIWMINLDGGTIETYEGFDQFHKGNLPITGITSKDLFVLDFSNETLTLGIIFIASIILTIIGLTVFLNLRKFNTK